MGRSLRVLILNCWHKELFEHKFHWKKKSKYNKNSNKIANDVKFILNFGKALFVKFAKKYFPRKIVLLLNVHPQIVVSC